MHSKEGPVWRRIATSGASNDRKGILRQAFVRGGNERTIPRVNTSRHRGQLPLLEKAWTSRR